MWNALKLVKMWESRVDAGIGNESNRFALDWFGNRLREAKNEVESMMQQFRL